MVINISLLCFYMKRDEGITLIRLDSIWSGNIAWWEDQILNPLNVAVTLLLEKSVIYEMILR